MITLKHVPTKAVQLKDDFGIPLPKELAVLLNIKAKQELYWVVVDGVLMLTPEIPCMAVPMMNSPERRFLQQDPQLVVRVPEITTQPEARANVDRVWANVDGRIQELRDQLRVEEVALDEVEHDPFP